jgi:hypothetical protein
MSGKVIDYDSLDAAAAVISPEKPIFMFNLMRFKPQATYLTDDPTFTSLPACTGQEAYYTRYIPKFFEFKSSGTPIFLGKPIQGVIATLADATEDAAHGGTDNEKWDAVAIVRYVNLGDFRKLVDSDIYRKTGMPHRVAAVEEYKLIVCEEMAVPTALADN